MTEKGEENSMDKQRLARIDGLLNEMVEKKMAAGVNALVLHGGNFCEKLCCFCC